MALAGIISTIIAAAALYHSNHTFKENQKFIKKQQFESTFFNMMKQLEDIVNKLSLNETKGRDVFEFFYKKYMFTISSDNITQYVNEHRIIKHYTMVSEYDTDLVYLYEGIYDQPIIAGNGIENAINMIGVTGYEYIDNLYILDHYFRYLYRILRFVDEAVFLENNSNDIINERYKFTSILRATLSPYELVFIFYNGISKYGNEKTKPLIEKYSILKNIRTNFLASSNLDEYLNAIADNCVNDYYRYCTNAKGLCNMYYYSAFYKNKTLFKIEDHRKAILKKAERKGLINDISKLHNEISKYKENNYSFLSNTLKDKITKLNNEFRPEYLNDNIIYHINNKMEIDNYEAKMNLFIHAMEKEHHKIKA